MWRSARTDYGRPPWTSPSPPSRTSCARASATVLADAGAARPGLVDGDAGAPRRSGPAWSSSAGPALLVPEEHGGLGLGPGRRRRRARGDGPGHDARPVPRRPPSSPPPRRRRLGCDDLLAGAGRRLAARHHRPRGARPRRPRRPGAHPGPSARATAGCSTASSRSCSTAPQPTGSSSPLAPQDGLGTFLVDGAASASPSPTMDPTRSVARLVLDGTPARAGRARRRPHADLATHRRRCTRSPWPPSSSACATGPC